MGCALYAPLRFPVASCQLPVASEVRRSGDWRLETGNWKLICEVRRSGNWKLETGNWYSLRKNYWQHALRRVHAAIVVSTLGHDHRFVFRTKGLIDELDEGLAPCASCWSLCHGAARRIEAAERQRVHLAQQIRRRT